MTFKRTLLLSILVIVGAALRLDFLVAHGFVIDSDEAIVGLMAKHILEGKGIPTFYYGQHYMGSFEPLIASLLFWGLGVSSVALKLTPFIFSLLLIILVYFLAELCLPRSQEAAESRIPLVAALFTAIPPSPLVIWSSMARGGFIEIVCIGTISLMLLFSWMRKSHQTPWGVISIAISLGFGWWVNNQIIFFVVPVALGCTTILARGQGGGVKPILSGALFGIFGFVAGGAPFWIYNLQNNFASFGIFSTASLSDFIKHLSGVFSTSLPILLGAKRFWSDTTIYPGALTLVTILYSGFVVAYLWTRMRHLPVVIVLKPDERRQIDLLMIFIATTILIFAATSFGSLVEAPRYLLPLYPAFFVCSAYIIYSCINIRVLSPVLVIGVLIINLLSSYSGGRAVPGEPFVYEGERASRDHSALINWLDERDVAFVRTNYWIGYRLAFEMKEQVRFIMFKAPEQKRILSYEKEGREMPERYTPYILTPSQAKPFNLAKKLGCLSFDTILLSGYTVIYDVLRVHPLLDRASLAKVQKSEITVDATEMKERAILAVDGDEGTRWGSGKPQSPGMEYVIRTKNPLSIALLNISYGPWETDFPRALEVQVKGVDGSTLTLSSEETEALAFVGEESYKFSMCLPSAPVQEIVLRQIGRDSFFDWSIAEIELFASK